MSQVSVKECVLALVEAVRDNTETYIVNGVENIVKVQYIATELDELESSGCNSENFKALLSAIADNMEYTLDEHLNFVPIINELYYGEALDNLRKEFGV